MNPIVELIKSYNTTAIALAKEAGVSKSQLHDMLSDNPKIKRPFTLPVINVFKSHGIILPEFDEVQQKVQQKTSKVQLLASTRARSSVAERTAHNRLVAGSIPAGPR
jgi:hypothetical protein